MRRAYADRVARARARGSRWAGRVGRGNARRRARPVPPLAGPCVVRALAKLARPGRRHDDIAVGELVEQVARLPLQLPFAAVERVALVASRGQGVALRVRRWRWLSSAD